tara:strand:- start:442 stop:1419 length:978 start_codon:yes stop_codon:yes gene_type:complete
MALLGISLDGLSPVGLAEIAPEDFTAIYNRAAYLYSTNTNVTLSVVGSGGSLGNMVDTRKAAGASTSTTAAEGGFATAAATPDITTISTGYATITQTVDNTAVTLPDNTDELTYPLMTMDITNNLQAMDPTSFFDNFILGALTQMAAGGSAAGQAGTYFIHTATSRANATLVSATPVFIDTRANAAAYTSAGIAETLDQPTTVTNYYLFKNTPSAPSYPSTALPMYYEPSDGTIRQYTAAQFDALLLPHMRYHAITSGDVASRLRYSLNGGGGTMGTGMADTYLSGASASGYTQRFVSTSDYRTQEFPNGTPAALNTYNLRLELY